MFVFIFPFPPSIAHAKAGACAARVRIIALFLGAAARRREKIRSPGLATVRLRSRKRLVSARLEARAAKSWIISGAAGTVRCRPDAGDRFTFAKKPPDRRGLPQFRAGSDGSIRQDLVHNDAARGICIEYTVLARRFADEPYWAKVDFAPADRRTIAPDEAVE
jgi:hypothetical protein